MAGSDDNLKEDPTVHVRDGVVGGETGERNRKRVTKGKREPDWEGQKKTGQQGEVGGTELSIENAPEACPGGAGH